MIATSADVHLAPGFASLDGALVIPPAGLDWLSSIAFPRAFAEALRWWVVFAALAGALGVYARAAWSVLAASLLVLLALPQRVGAVAHVHHLVWVAALLAASPCADVWSVDSRFAPRALGRSALYTVPVLFLRALVGAIYFFPGLHKLLTFLHGVEPGLWFRSQLHWKWLQAGVAPLLPVPLSPGLLTASALLAVGFELSMPVLVAFRGTRPVALAAAVAFHFATARLLYIRFETLLAVLVSLVDLGPTESIASTLRTAAQSLKTTRIVGAVLLVGVGVTGVLGATQLYPFACYPTFAAPAPETMPSARIDVISLGGRCSLPRPRSNPEWVQAFVMAGAYGEPPSAPRARAYVLQRLIRHGARCELASASRIELYAERLSWDESARGVKRISQRLIYTVSAASLGIAPADGANASSSPAR